MKSSTNIKPPIFFLRNCNYNYSVIYIHQGYILHRVLFIINTLIPFLCEMMYACHIKFIAAVPEHFSTPCFRLPSSAKRFPPSASFKGPKSWKLEGAQSRLYWGCGRTVHCIVEIVSLVCCLALLCRTMTWFIFLFDWTVQIHCFNFLNVHTYHSELTVTRHCKNSTNKIPFLSQKMLPMTLPSETYILNFFLYGDAIPLIVLFVSFSFFHTMLEKFCTDIILNFLYFQHQP